MPVNESSDIDATETKATLSLYVPHEASAAAPILCYCIASILMTIINKFVVSGVDFSMNFLLLAIQSVFGVACVIIANKAGVIRLRSLTRHDMRTWFPISALLVCVVYTGSKSLQFLRIPVYTIFKNLSIILIAYGEVIWFNGKITRLTFISFILIVLSSMLAAWSDISVSVQRRTSAVGLSSIFQVSDPGYIWMLTNCCASAAYVLAMRKSIKVTKFSDWESMFCNNLLCIPILGACSLVLEDWGKENLQKNFPQHTRITLLLAVALSGVTAVGISFSTAWCIRVTSSTTYSMVGALNKLPVAASGMLFFGDPMTLGSVSALFVGFFAGLLFSMAKNNQNKEDQRMGSEILMPLPNRATLPPSLYRQ